ncbi:response regulator transcription factor [Aquabacter sp. CN5-332]|uniref:response regulator transcription factor n=1 Tax=Aquabacter sp. CN5-332 TaxID=3156608 RepID=UPI0032B548A8
MQIRILLVEDDDDLRDSLQAYLTDAGLQVRAVRTAEHLVEEIAAYAPDIVVLDINLPGQDGFEAAMAVREHSSVGIIMLTGRSMRTDRLHGLSVGADHYLVKPADPAELEMVIRNLHRRVKGPEAASRPDEVDRDVWGFNAKRWTLSCPHGTKVSLSAAERHLLEKLLERTGEPVARADLVAPGSRQDLDSGRGLDLLVFRLRRKVERECGLSLPVLSARSIGYVFAGAIRNDND